MKIRISVPTQYLVLFVALVHVLLISFFSAIPITHAHSVCGAIRILPVGDSITLGIGSNDNSSDTSTMVGYRKFLYDALRGRGYNIDMVGPLRAGYGIPGFDPDHSGYSGQPSRFIRDNIYNILDRSPADFLLLHIGTNLFQPYDQVTQNQIMDEIQRWEDDNNQIVHVLWARIINTSPPQKEVIEYNDRNEIVIQNRINAGDEITIVNMDTEAGIDRGDLIDQVHPNINGYYKMYKAWEAKLLPLLENLQPCEDTRLSVASPSQGLTVQDDFNVRGWALDLKAGPGNGPGVSEIRIYKGNVCTGQILASGPLNVDRADVANFFSLDSSYIRNGYSLTLENIPDGPLTFTVCARNAITNQFDTRVTRTVNVQAIQENTRITLGTPTNNEIVEPDFHIFGWAMDTLAGPGNGTGVRNVFVFDGNSCSGNVRLAFVTNVDRPDVANVFGLDNSYWRSGYSKTITDIPEGNYTFTICARNLRTNKFEDSITRTVNVQAIPENTRITLRSPSNNENVQSSFNISGWAADTLAGVGKGTGIKNIAVYDGNSCSGTPRLVFGPNVDRPDAMNALGLDSSYLRMGYLKLLYDIPEGPYTFTICARNARTNDYEDSITRTVNVLPPKNDIRLSFGKPDDGTILGPSFVVGGWAYDQLAGNGNGTGISEIVVFKGNYCSGNVLVRGKQTVNRPDVVNIFNLDNSYLQSGYSLLVTNAPTGGMNITVCARAKESSKFEVAITKHITVDDGITTIAFDEFTDPEILRELGVPVPDDDDSLEGFTDEQLTAIAVATEFNAPVANQAKLPEFDPVLTTGRVLDVGIHDVFGERIEWTIGLRNEGEIAGQRVRLIQNMDPLLRIENVIADKGQIDIINNIVTITMDTVQPGEELEFTVITSAQEFDVVVKNQILLVADNWADRRYVELTSTVAQIEELPATGETPLWRILLFTLVGFIGSGAVIIWRKRRYFVT